MKSNKFKSLFKFIMIFALLCYSSQMLAQKGDSTYENSILKVIDDSSVEWGPCPPFIPEGCNVTLLQGDMANPNTDVVFKFQGGTDIPNHWHTSAERMILLAGKLEVTYEGEPKKTMKAGNYAFGPAKKPHVAKCVSKDPCLLYVGFVEPVDAFAIED